MKSDQEKKKEINKEELAPDICNQDSSVSRDGSAKNIIRIKIKHPTKEINKEELALDMKSSKQSVGEEGELVNNTVVEMQSLYDHPIKGFEVDDKFPSSIEENLHAGNLIDTDFEESESKYADVDSSRALEPNSYHCKVCNQPFLSVKSVSGHMRTHPDRLWRGLNPPSDEVLLQSSSSILPEIPKWGGIARRGRKGTKSSPPNHVDVINAVSSLASMSKVPVRRQEPNKSEDGRSFILGDLRIQRDIDNLEGELLSISIKDDVQLHNHNGLIDCKRNIDKLEKDSESVKKRKMDVLENVVDSSRVTPKRTYKCNDCNRCFPSHQALGGHMASHNKNKGNLEGVAVENEVEEGDQIANGKELIDSDAAPSKNVALGHKCDVCGKSYLTGQQLGGHKRKHYWPGSKNPAMNSVETGGESSNRFRDFDLNKTPDNEDEDL